MQKSSLVTRTGVSSDFEVVGLVSRYGIRVGRMASPIGSSVSFAAANLLVVYNVCFFVVMVSFKQIRNIVL